MSGHQMLPGEMVPARSRVGDDGGWQHTEEWRCGMCKRIGWDCECMPPFKKFCGRDCERRPEFAHSIDTSWLYGLEIEDEMFGRNFAGYCRTRDCAYDFRGWFQTTRRAMREDRRKGLTEAPDIGPIF